MNVLLTILLAVQILTALGMIGLILMQHGKGADAGAAFGGGGGGSASLFGASGGANFLSRSTAVLAAVFLAATLGLAYFGNLREAPSSGSVLEGSALSTPAPAAQIPGTDTGGSVPAPTVVPAQPAGTGAAQIPGN
ncbi:MAG: preprotein translocase subunit SecG [Hydrogenophaga sp.]|nr:preprotein translocase subunit SecG [Hydrogenophaga sp.]